MLYNDKNIKFIIILYLHSLWFLLIFTQFFGQKFIIKFIIIYTEKYRIIPSNVKNGQNILSIPDKQKSLDLQGFSLLVGAGGFEPPKSLTIDLQSNEICGYNPYISSLCRHRIHFYHHFYHYLPLKLAFNIIFNLKRFGFCVTQLLSKNVTVQTPHKHK